MYQRTILGNQEIQARHLGLSARIRTLLLLIESSDLKKLDQRIAHPEHFETLLELGLIIKTDVQEELIVQQISESQATHTSTEKQSISVQPPISEQIILKENHPINTNTESSYTEKPSVTKVITNTTEILDESEQFPLLGFVEIKELMQETLQQYCGLMAKHLIAAIKHAQTTQDLRVHQKKWLTSLFETRISRKNLTVLLQRINQSLQKLDSTH